MIIQFQLVFAANLSGVFCGDLFVIK